MKVLHIYKDYYPPVIGGIERHINLLANGLAQRGVEVEVLVSNTGIRLERERINGISVTKAPQLGRFASAPLNITFPYWLRRLGKNTDILHFHFPNPTGELSYLVSGLDQKVVVSYHSDIIRQVNLLKLYSPFLLKFLKRADIILTSSNNYLMSSKVLSNFQSKCKVIPYGHKLPELEISPKTTEKIDALRKAYGPSIILFIGRFRNYKGLHILIEAMKKVEGRLLLIGTGPLKKDLRKQVAEARLNKKISFLGELPDQEMIFYLHACDMLVLPSHLRSEAFGFVQLEAMLYGKPVVCTELETGTSFVNQDQKTGLVIPPNDVETLANAINYLLKHPEVRNKYGKAGIERVEQYFSVEKMLDNIISVYQSILSRHPFANIEQ